MQTVYNIIATFGGMTFLFIVVKLFGKKERVESIEIGKKANDINIRRALAQEDIVRCLSQLCMLLNLRPLANTDPDSRVGVAPSSAQVLDMNAGISLWLYPTVQQKDKRVAWEVHRNKQTNGYDVPIAGGFQVVVTGDRT